MSKRNTPVPNYSLLNGGKPASKPKNPRVTIQTPPTVVLPVSSATPASRNPSPEESESRGSRNRGGRSSGSKNYDNWKLLDVVSRIRPIGEKGWEKVAELYQVETGELQLRRGPDVRKHWFEKVYRNGERLTGLGADSIYVKANEVQNDIMAAEEAETVIRASSETDNRFDEDLTAEERAELLEVENAGEFAEIGNSEMDEGELNTFPISHSSSANFPPQSSSSASYPPVETTQRLPLPAKNIDRSKNSKPSGNSVNTARRNITTILQDGVGAFKEMNSVPPVSSSNPFLIQVLNQIGNQQQLMMQTIMQIGNQQQMMMQTVMQISTMLSYQSGFPESGPRRRRNKRSRDDDYDDDEEREDFLN